MPISSSFIGRLAIFAAVFLQAIGKVAYGTWLSDFPSALFVLISFTLTAAFFFSVSGRGIGTLAWSPLIVLNVSTALTFLCFFYALGLIEPAIVGAIEIGIGPVLALMIAFFLHGAQPNGLRIVICIGILAGCAVLSLSAMQGSGLVSNQSQHWLGISASLAAGFGAVLITMASKALLGKGWKFGAVLAHRFYLIIPVAAVLSLSSDTSSIEWSLKLTAILIGISVVGVLAPLYLLQVGIGRCDTYSVMVTMAALPIITFLLEGFSPAYAWSWITASGIALVTAFLLLDVFAKRD